MENKEPEKVEVEAENVNEDENYYDNEEEDYLISQALGNIKNDEGTKRSRPRRIPVYKLQIEDKDKIPKMPDKILKEPNDADFQKRVDELKEANKKKSQSIQEWIDKKREASYGANSDDKNNIFKQHKELTEEKKKILEALKKDESATQDLRNKMNALSDKVKAFDRFKLGTNQKKIYQEIKKIQEQLSFGELDLTEEKNQNERKRLLEDYLKALKPFQEFRMKHKDDLKKDQEPRKKLKEIREKLDKLKSQIEEAKKKKIESSPQMNLYQQNIESLRKDKAENSEKIQQIYVEWDKAWEDYNEQQKLINYIKSAEAKIKGLEKRQEKEKKRKEKEAKKNNEGMTEKFEKGDIIMKESDKKDIRVKKCEDLKNYFEALLPKIASTENKKETGPMKNVINTITEDLQKGKLQKIESNEEEIFATGPKKKKGKKPGENNKKKNQKNKNGKNGLDLDIEMIQKINEAGLQAPLTIEDIPKFLENLEKKKVSFETGVDIEIPQQKESKPIKKEEEKKPVEKKEKKPVEKKEEKISESEPIKEEKKSVPQPKKEEPKQKPQLKKKEEEEEEEEDEEEEEKKVESKPVITKKEEPKPEPVKEESKPVESTPILTKVEEKKVEVKKEDEEEEDEEEEEEEEEEDKKK